MTPFNLLRHVIDKSASAVKNFMAPRLLLWTLPFAASTSLLGRNTLLPSGRIIVIIIIVIFEVLHDDRIVRRRSNRVPCAVWSSGGARRQLVSWAHKGIEGNEPLRRLPPLNNRRHLIHIAAPCR
jgi:hypothetical protein